MVSGSRSPVPSIPLRGPGADNPHFMEQLEKLEAEVHATQQAKAERKQARSEEEQTAGVSRAALNMRERRKRADVQAFERKAIAAKDKALRLLAKRHPEEFRALMQECRKALGLPPALPRGRHVRDDTLEVTPQHPAQSQQQQECQHGAYPLRKLPYGKFCGNCGQRL